jgi:O-acetyl-ADP-ribose deacetylase (regulator of RNase III)
MSLSYVHGDLLDQEVDAIVNAWNRNVIPWWLLLPQGVSAAIKRRAGSMPFRELGTRPMPLGSARHTSAGNLPFRGIIHVAALDMLWRASSESIARSARAACELALAFGYRSLAMPLLGSGAGGFPAHRAIEAIAKSIASYDQRLEIRLVRFAS